MVDWEKIKADIKNEVQEQLRLQSIPNSPSLPIGYNPIEKIRGALYTWVAVPFNGEPVWCKLRASNATQLQSCGNISNIILDKEHKYTHEDLIAVRNYQEALCRITFVVPTFDEIGKIINQEDFVIADKEKELERIKKEFNARQKGLSSVESAALQTKIDTLELFLGYILPNDTMAFITSWAMGNDITDIKKLTREQLIEAAALAEQNHGAPSDYLSGIYTDHNKVDIDKAAWHEWVEYLNMKKAEDRGTRIVGGPKSRRSR
jgi:hypothetical protein